MTDNSAKSLLEVFDPPLCCPSGACGPDPDPKLARFAADLAWLRRQGIEVRRHNLAQEPLAFAENAAVKRLMTENSEDGLPAILMNGEVVLHGRYPDRAELARWFGLSEDSAAEAVEAQYNGLVTPVIAELVAIGAAIASNCEPCFRYHYDQARRLGASNEDMLEAVNIALRVKDAPAQAMVRLAQRYLVPDEIRNREGNPDGN